MDRKKLLETAATAEDRILMSKVIDMFSACENKNIARNTNFLNGHEISVALSVASHFNVKHGLFGGYGEAERMIMLCCPDFLEIEQCVVPICVIKIRTKNQRCLSHRDYMGAILNLGIKREKIGDIVVCDDCAYVVCMEDIAEYIASQVEKVGNCGVEMSVSSFENAEIPPKKFKETEASLGSVRLDSVVGAGMGISRSESSSLVEKGLVSVNWEAKTKCDFRPSEGDVVSVRGSGRLLICRIGGTSKKGRTFVTLRKYI